MFGVSEMIIRTITKGWNPHFESQSLGKRGQNFTNSQTGISRVKIIKIGGTRRRKYSIISHSVLLKSWSLSGIKTLCN